MKLSEAKVPKSSELGGECGVKIELTIEIGKLCFCVR